LRTDMIDKCEARVLNEAGTHTGAVCKRAGHLTQLPYTLELNAAKLDTPRVSGHQACCIKHARHQGNTSR
jgi:hypothetical protein